jgi:hypothetical protein
MESSFEQASVILDQAILSYSDGEIEQAAQLMADAAAMLHDIEVAPVEPQCVAEVFQPVQTETAADMPGKMLLLAAGPLPEPAALQAMEIESAKDSSLAAAAA